jgi:hypothetical protein
MNDNASDPRWPDEQAESPYDLLDAEPWPDDILPDSIEGPERPDDEELNLTARPRAPPRLIPLSELLGG